jgi:signal transduction histidine kinase
MGAALVALVLVAVTVSRMRSATGRRLQRWAWLASALIISTAISVVVAAVAVIVPHGPSVLAGALSVCILVPGALLAGRVERLAVSGLPLLRTVVVLSGTVIVTTVVAGFVILGLGDRPAEQESGSDVLALGLVAAAAGACIAVAARPWLVSVGHRVAHDSRTAPGDALRAFSGGLTRSVTMDELMLALAESMTTAFALTSAEVWTSRDSRLTRTVRVPYRASTHLEIAPEAREVIVRSRAQGATWTRLWLPDLVTDDDSLIRVVSVPHQGELLGLLVLRRPPEVGPFTAEEDQTLIDVSRQLGLALHNLRLDSALQESLAALEIRNAQLVASRARIVAAADESRRRIERDLHDGAQQHLVALAMNLSLAEGLLESDPAACREILVQLRGDVQATLTELRELAHGIYPPLLRHQGLGPALRAAALRAPIDASVADVDPGRFEPEIEAAVYFCCVEALTNAGKYAGPDCHAVVTVEHRGGRLTFSVADDGAGFDHAVTDAGQGLINMRDRLGAVGGELTVTSAPRLGTVVRGTVLVESA